MAKRRRRKKNYKFTEKTQSRQGMLALALAAVSLAVLILVIASSFHNRGNGSMYLGSAGVAAMLVGLVSVVIAVKSLHDDKSFKLFPYLATAISLLTTGTWIALYVVGGMGLASGR